MRYAYLVASGTGNCGNNSFTFRCIILDTVGLADNNQVMAASLGHFNGQPVIAYTGHFHGNTILKVAYPQTNGNCGPLDTSLHYTWRCDVVDSSSGDLGYYPSVQVDSKGTIHIAYYDYTAGNLKYAVSNASINTARVYLPLLVR